MKTIAWTLALAALAAAAAHGADSSKSVALVRAMRTDEIAVANAKLAFLGGNLLERFGKTNSACIKRVPYAEFTAGWARVVDGALTPQEIDTGLAYYQSPAGKKYVEGLLRRMRERQGEESQLPEVSGKEEISPAELAQISAFASTDLGLKFNKEFLQSPAALAWGREMTEQIARKCGGK